MSVFRLLRVCLLLLLFAGCIRDEGPTADAGPHRTVLVYLAGDNTISADIGRVTEAIRSGWSYTGGTLVIYHDSRDGAPRLLRVRGGCRVTPTPYIETVEEFPEENSASAEVLARIVRRVVSDYPADSYGLVVASHGSGWLPAGTLADPPQALRERLSAEVPDRGTRTICTDEHPATLGGGTAEMELEDFAAALPDGRFDFIVFEACLMSGVEAAYELRSKSRYMLASSAEMLAPGFADIYPQAIGCLMNCRRPLAESLQDFGERYYETMNARSGAYRSATLSLIDLSQMEALAACAQEATAQAGEGFCDISDLQRFDRPGSYGENLRSPRYFDAEQYVERIAPDAAARFSAQLSKTVLWKAATPAFLEGQNGFEIRRHSGLTTYIPQALFPGLNAAYERTAWYRRTRQ